METTAKRIHPLVAGASVSVILVSLVGVAAITGLLPTSHGSANQSAANQPAAAPVATITTPTPADVAASAASQAAAQAVDTRSAKADFDEPAKPAAKPVQKAKAPTTYHPPVATAQAPASYPAPAASPSYAPPPPPVAQAPVCYDCGRVVAVNAVQTQQPTSGVGGVGGAVLGGLLGNQVGGGNGRTIATIAGAVGGAYAGNEVEKRTRHAVTYQVKVRMEDGHTRSFPYNNQPQWNVGDRVRVVDGYLQPMGARS